MRHILLALALLLVPVAAKAEPTTRLRQMSPTGSAYLLNGVAATASSGARTATFTVGGYSRLTISFSIVRVAATAITMTCSASTDHGAIFNVIADQTISSGTGTLVAHTWSYAVSASGGVIIDIGTGSYDSVSCTFGATGGGSSDLLTVSAISGAP